MANVGWCDSVMGTRLMDRLRDSTYGFSPVSGMINQHTIDSIQPAPHQAAYDALIHAFGIGSDIRPGEVRAVDRDSH